MKVPQNKAFGGPHEQISGSAARIAATLSCSICRRYLSHESKTT